MTERVVLFGCGDVGPIHEPIARSVRVMSVKVVEKRVSEEVANGQAAMGGSFAGSASISGGVSSTISSICM